jgi:hypothetical protein
MIRFNENFVSLNFSDHPVRRNASPLRSVNLANISSLGEARSDSVT